MLRAVLVDDERLARSEMRRLLEQDGRVTVAGEAGSIAAAVAAIERIEPDVVFLDIRLGRASGFDVADQIDHRIPIVFVTAFDAHAVRAFDVHALDYLLKPVDPRRLSRAVDRLAAAGASQPRPGHPSDRPERRAASPDDWLFVRSGNRRVFIRVGTLTHLTAAGDWVTLHVRGGRTVVTGDPLAAWEGRLPRSFLRTHRGVIVNLERVTRLEPWSHGAWHVWIDGVAAPLLLSRRHAARARTVLGAG